MPRNVLGGCHLHVRSATEAVLSCSKQSQSLGSSRRGIANCRVAVPTLRITMKTQSEAMIGCWPQGVRQLGSWAWAKSRKVPWLLPSSHKLWLQVGANHLSEETSAQVHGLLGRLVLNNAWRSRIMSTGHFSGVWAPKRRDVQSPLITVPGVAIIVINALAQPSDRPAGAL